MIDRNAVFVGRLLHVEFSQCVYRQLVTRQQFVCLSYET